MKKRLTTHDFTATYQEGVVSQIDPRTHRIKATIPALEDLETAWLPFATPFAGGNQFYALPDKGELVAIILDARGESGYVLGAIYNAKDPVPVTDSEIWLHKFANGTEIAHNRKTGDVVVNTSGVVTVTASQAIVNATTEINGNTTINGDTTINGKLNATGTITSDTEVSSPSVKQGNVSLGSHVHTGVESGNKRSGQPE
ncbi:phage baseplate assembly protein V [Pasteurella multocida subsp. multocida]|uniref:Phage baseplate assembly protein V n=1 Tax=Pasteurella multocida TaxID=747 RepID=A0A9X3UT88_PASMD|nr:phage baseplate assembly protein V [Pasteurella multocida]MBF6981402.1 phage baseplate assembly protein V [Pasteurella multocida]MBF6985774.1 phage baseplate assembly protein V [Pasteurella multocida]MDA5609300.1 phage baseplate assembly protein V [Pasteurella multocida subsp. multocida]MDA5611505.1 phage baseplate assembly protein V [Pasteurella multocida]MDA5613997.1 phage baseplate assembly protein V [Pasteurella multocida]